MNYKERMRLDGLNPDLIANPQSKAKKTSAKKWAPSYNDYHLTSENGYIYGSSNI